MGENMNFSKYWFSSLLATVLLALPFVAGASTARHVTEEKSPGQEIDKGPKTTVHGAGHRTTHNGSNHVYVGTTLLGDQIEIEDGSYWMTRPDDRPKLQNWFPGDSLKVMPNYDSWLWWSIGQFPYVIYNERTYETLQVDISAAPIWDGFYRRFIREIYKPAYGDGSLKLNDGTVWVLADKYRETWNVWGPEQTIIIGSNNAGPIGDYFIPDVLINVTASVQFIPSKCIN